MKKIFGFIAILLFCLEMKAQVISSNPFFVTDNDSVTVTFNASLGNGALMNNSQPIYAHTGVITDQSTSLTNWRYVKSAWGVADTNVLLTQIGANQYQIRFHVRNYYGVPGGETILYMAFLFRNAAGTTVARNADGSDMYLPVYNAAVVNCAIVNPFHDQGTPLLLANNGQNIPVTGISNYSATLTINLNGVQQAQVVDDTINTTVTSSQLGLNTISLIADDGSTSDTFDFQFVVNPTVDIQPLPAGTDIGVNIINDSTVVLALYAPLKNFVYLLGTFNNFAIDTGYFMKVTPDLSTWWIQVNGLNGSLEYVYQYLIDGTLKIADPYSGKVLDPSNDNSIGAATYPNPTPYPSALTSGIASVLQTAPSSYTWAVNNFQKPAKTDLVIYELLVRDFLSQHNYQTIIDTLNYLSDLGINAIELMPINEFEGNQSWGYNPSFLFANDKYYGTKNKLKELIDSCHARGIAVIQDIVFNHQCGQSPMVQMYFDAATGKPAANSPWFNVDATHDFNVCYDMNHESQATQYFVQRACSYWLQEYKVDGFRFDLSKGFTQRNSVGNLGLWASYDSARVAVLQLYANNIWSVDPNAYVILEHFGDNSEETVLQNSGMMLWGNANYNFNEATMGYPANSNFGYGINYKSRNWTNPHLVGYMESHDEERLMYKNYIYGNQNGSYNTKDTLTALARMQEAVAFFLTVPGPKMIWMGGELGYDVSINNPCRTCNHPFKWNYFPQYDRQYLYNIYGAIAKLRTTEPAFESNVFSLSAGGAMKSLHINDASMNVTVLGNFDVATGNIYPGFQHTGWWYDFLSGDSINVTNANAAISLVAGEYHIYTDVRLQLPDLSIGIGPLQTDQLKNIYVWPNPVSDVTTIAFKNSSTEKIAINIYDLQGRFIEQITDQQFSAGSHSVQWNPNREKIKKGMYVANIRSASLSQSVRIVLN